MRIRDQVSRMNNCPDNALCICSYLSSSENRPEERIPLEDHEMTIYDVLERDKEMLHHRNTLCASYGKAMRSLACANMSNPAYTYALRTSMAIVSGCFTSNRSTTSSPTPSEDETTGIAATPTIKESTSSGIFKLPNKPKTSPAYRRIQPPVPENYSQIPRSVLVGYYRRDPDYKCDRFVSYLPRGHIQPDGKVKQLHSDEENCALCKIPTLYGQPARNVIFTDLNCPEAQHFNLDNLNYAIGERPLSQRTINVLSKAKETIFVRMPLTSPGRLHPRGPMKF
jgi:hypothetical protein